MILCAITIGTTLDCPGHIRTGMFKGLKLPAWVNLIVPDLNPSYVAQEVLKAVMYRKDLIILPKSYYLIWIARLLPLKLFKTLTNIFGLRNAMKNHVRREINCE